MKSPALRPLLRAAVLWLVISIPLPAQNIVPLLPLPSGYRLDVQFGRGHTAKKPNESMRLRSPDGKVLIDFGRYTTIEASPAAPHLFLVKKAGAPPAASPSLGIFDAKLGQEVLPCGPYTYLQHVQGTVFVVGVGKITAKTSFNAPTEMRPERFGVFDTATGQEVQPGTAREMKIHPGHLIRMVDAQNKVALLGLDGREVAPQRYLFAPHKFEGRPDTVVVKAADGKMLYGYVDSFGRPITPVHYTPGDPFFDGRAIVQRDGRVGFIDETGREVVPPRYAKMTKFVGGLAGYARTGRLVRGPGAEFDTFVGSEWGFITRDGRELGAAIYEAVGLPEGDYALKDQAYVKHQGRWLTIDPRLGDAALASAVPARPRLFQSTKGDLPWGYMIPSGEVIAAPKWQIAGNFDDYGHAIVGHRNKLRDKQVAWRDAPEITIGLIDAQGSQVLPEEYCFINPLAPTRYAVGRWDTATKKIRVGAVDVATGKSILPPDYEVISRGTDTLMAARQNGRFGLIDASGRWHLEPRFIAIHPFADGLAVVRDEKGYTWIDSEFKVISDQRYTWAGDFENGTARVATRLDNWGRTAGVQRIDRAGRVLATEPDLPPPVYTAQKQRCQACGGTGGRFESKENSSSHYVGSTLRNYEPGGGTGNFRTVTWQESVRVGNCYTCGGRGTN